MKKIISIIIKIIIYISLFLLVSFLDLKKYLIPGLFCIIKSKYDIIYYLKTKTISIFLCFTPMGKFGKKELIYNNLV